MAEDSNDVNSLLMQYTSEILKRNELMKQYANQPPEVKKRVAALMKMQVEITNLDVKFQQKVSEIEKEFESKYQEIFDKRRDIINGNYEPTSQECDCTGTDINFYITQALENLNLNEGNGTSENLIEGIPNFWLTILKYFSKLDSFVFEHDEPLLKHLVDVRAITKIDPTLSFVLEFHFSPNEYFSNKILTKEYFLKCAPDPDDYLSFDGPEIYKCVGCKINWYEGKNFTKKTVKKKSSGTTRNISIKSFFNFFDPPQLPNENDPKFDDINDYLEKDFEIGHYMKERIIPRAVLYFTGESEELSPNISTANTESDLESETEEQLN